MNWRPRKYNTPEIQELLSKVANHWKFSRAGFTLMEKREFVPFVILTTTDSMLERMEKVTGLYAGPLDRSPLTDIRCCGPGLSVKKY